MRSFIFRYLITVMKLATILLLLLTISNFCYGQGGIDIADRTKLPLEVYDSFKNYRAILIGEIHGTNEVPQVVESMVKLWLAKDEKIILALELPQSQQQFVDSFFATGNFPILENAEPFNSHVQDGRSGIATATMLKNLFGLKNLKVLFFDPSEAKSRQERDSAMAELILQKTAENPEHKIILLAGNLHAKLIRGMSSDSTFKPMGYLLAQHSLFQTENLLSLKVVFESGKSCFCDGPDDNSCKENTLPVNNTYNHLSTSPNFLHLPPAYKNTKGYSGILFIKHITASKPLNK